MTGWIVNQATVEVPICNKTHMFRSNSVRVKIRRGIKLAKVHLQSKKVVCGACLRANQFKFIVFDQNGEEVARAGNDKNGDIIFPELTFEQPGVYVYTMREINKPHKDWILDHRRYTIIVTILECQNGKLIATTSYPDGLPVFVNKYVPCFDQECIPGSGERIYLPRSDNSKCPGNIRKNF